MSSDMEGFPAPRPPLHTHIAQQASLIPLFEIPTRPSNSGNRLTSALTSSTQEKSLLLIRWQAFPCLYGVADGARTTREKDIENQGLTEHSGVLCRQIRDTDS